MQNSSNPQETVEDSARDARRTALNTRFTFIHYASTNAEFYTDRSDIAAE